MPSVRLAAPSARVGISRTGVVTSFVAYRNALRTGSCPGGLFASRYASDLMVRIPLSDSQGEVMKKNSLKKIALHRETLRQLDDEQTRTAAGGATTNGAATCFCTDTCTLMPGCH